MIKLIDIVYYSHNDYASTTQVLEKHAPSFGYIPYLKSRINIHLVKHFKEEASKDFLGVPVVFFKRTNRFWQIPLRTHMFVKRQKPGIVIIQGFIFPVQLIALKIQLGKNTKILVQHHGESPFKGFKWALQKIADRCISKYLFSSIGNADEWLAKKIISNKNKCAELQSGSTYFDVLNKKESRTNLAIVGEPIFLWVGRLNENKDPLTVLKAFDDFVQYNEAAKLYMIFHTEELIEEIRIFVRKRPALSNAVKLIGKIAHDRLALWYTASDFFISASRKEATGYALIEAMSCGCIPIVTAIPPFKKLTANGAVGYLYPIGDIPALTKILKDLPSNDIDRLSMKTIDHFKQKLSFKNIADDLYNLCVALSK